MDDVRATGENTITDERLADESFPVVPSSIVANTSQQGSLGYESVVANLDTEYQTSIERGEVETRPP